LAHDDRWAESSHVGWLLLVVQSQILVLDGGGLIGALLTAQKPRILNIAVAQLWEDARKNSTKKEEKTCTLSYAS
jgi:hypothetical protein